MAETIDQDVLRESFPSVFKKFEAMSLDKIYDALNDHEFDEDETIAYLTDLTNKTRAGQQRSSAKKPASGGKSKENLLEMPERSIKGKERAAEDIKGKGKEKAVERIVSDEKGKDVEKVAEGQMTTKRQFARRRLIREDSDEEGDVLEKAQKPEQTDKFVQEDVDMADDPNGSGESKDSTPDPTTATRGRRESTRIKRKAVEGSTEEGTAAEENVTKKVKAASRSHLQTYTIPPDSEIESGELEILGEEPDDDNSTDAGPANFDSLPMRTLNDFVLYDIAAKNRLRSLDDIGNEGVEIRAAGLVKPVFREGGEEEEEEEEVDGEEGETERPVQRVQLTTIFYWQLDMRSDGNSEIWLRTQYCWYKLLRPSPLYAATFAPVFSRIRLANMAEKAMADNPRITYEDFIRGLNNPAESSSGSFSGPLTSNQFELTLTEKDIRSNIDFIMDEISAWIEEIGAYGVLASPLLQRLTEIRDEESRPKKGKGAARRRDWGDTDTRRTVRNINKQVLEKPNPTCVTPHIATMAKNMFSRRLVEIKQAAEEAHHQPEASVSEVEGGKKSAYKALTTSVFFTGEPLATVGTTTYYAEARVDSEIVKIGDCVYMRNEASDEPWFARVVYMFQEGEHGDRMFHAQYFSHGKETILEEFAGDRELFILDNCADNDLECVMGKCNVKLLGAEEVEPIDFERKNWWFYRYWYDEKLAAFEDARLHEPPHTVFQYCADHEGCASCEATHKRRARNTPRWLLSGVKPRGFMYKGHEYHLHDYVYLTTDDRDAPYDIAQVIGLWDGDDEDAGEGDIKGYFKPVAGKKKRAVDGLAPAQVRARVRLLGRYDDLLKRSSNIHYDVLGNPNPVIKDCRRLYLTDEEHVVSVDRFEGTCWVLHQEDVEDLAAFKDEEETFYIDSHAPRKSAREGTNPLERAEVVVCDWCRNERNEKARKRDGYMRQVHRLRALDIFSGCGGLTCGMEQTGVVETKYAVEFSPSAALSFEKNFPDSTAYSQCANVLLERAIAKHSRGEALQEMKDHLGKPLKDMPAPEDVDFIYCGPPCQGFSGINRFKKADDIKNSLVCTALSYVDFYKPEYFLLENVRGMVAFKLGGEQDGTNKIKGGIKMGVVKFILRCLTSMGYQTRFSIQQAGQYGVAQSRRRFFVWGARRGSSLPDFPQPSNCFPKQGSLAITLPNGHSFSYMHRTNGQAPHAAVTVGDSISELPGFEYRNPHDLYPATDGDKEQERNAQVPRLAADGVGCIGRLVQDYERPPLTEFQRRIRNGSEKVHGHATRGFNKLNAERICCIEMRAGADHSSLPEKLKPWCLHDKDSAASRHNGWKGLYGRLNFDGQFQTTLTEMSPMGKQGTVLHPTQRRVLTVRECARSQGFPDRFVFYSTAPDGTGPYMKDSYRQVGNAVPVPLAFALGVKLCEAMMDKWLEEEERKSKGKGKGRA